MRLDINFDDDSKTYKYKRNVWFIEINTHTQAPLKVSHMNNFVLGDKMRAKFIPTLSREAKFKEKQ